MKTLICAPVRTPIGGFQGSLSSFTAPQLGAIALKATLERAGLDPKHAQEVYMGCVLTAGIGQAPARQAALKAGVPQNVPCTTVGKVCGSGLKAVMLADQAIRAGEAECVLAGGMESMSQTPYLLPKVRNGLRMGNGELIDSMIKDGLWDVYNDFHMGTAAEMASREYGLTREAQDAYATESYRRAQRAVKEGLFNDEIVPVEVVTKKSKESVTVDEEISRGDPSKFAALRPAFDPQGVVTAANSSTLSDGASAMIVCSEAFAKAHNLKAIARIVAQTQAAQAPEWFSTAPAASLKTLMQKAGITTRDVDLWEINEAFSAVSLANMKLLDLDASKVNVRGGAVAMGHPIGASGARILTTLCHALKQERKKLGAASLCIGGGEAVSVLVESLS